MKFINGGLTVILCLIAILALNIRSHSQSLNSTAPIKWQRYSDGGKKFSFLFPKLPTVVDESDRCRGYESYTYGSYADGAGYLVKVISKVDVPGSCRFKEKFSEKLFNDRISTVKRQLGTDEIKGLAGGELKISGNGEVYKFIKDHDGQRWFELAVVGADESRSEVADFLKSTDFSTKFAGIEFGEGALATIGDLKPPAEDNEQNAEKTAAQSRPDTEKPDVVKESTPQITVIGPLRMVLKPRASYTAQAKNKGVVGSAVLVAVFSQNGSVTSVKVINALPDGLTEQAVAAVRKIIFIPAKRNGVRVSIAKTVEYSFTIY
jgi:TonB family protein